MIAPQAEARKLARHWPWSLASYEKHRLYELVRKWMAGRRMGNDVGADLGEWLGRDIDDAHDIAREASKGARL